MSPSDKTLRGNRRSLLRAVGAGAVLFTAGCIGDDNGDDEEVDSADPDGPQHTFVFASDGDLPDTLDPAKNSDSPTTVSCINFYDSLVFLGDDWEPIPWVATDWEIPDEETYQFELRDDIVFHSGNDLTAEDVAYSMERAMDVGIAFTGVWSDIVESTEVLGDYEVQFNLTEPFAPFLTTMSRLFVLDSELVEENDEGDYGEGWLNRNTAGSGPYKFVSLTEDTDMIMESYTDHWQEWDSDNFHEIRYELYPEESTHIEVLRSGDAHMSNKNQPIDTINAWAESEYVDIAEEVGPKLYHVTMHTNKAPTDDINVRRALAHAMSYDTILEEVFGLDSDAQMRGILPPDMLGKNEELEPYQQDIDLAQEYLDESEYSIEEINENLEFWYCSGCGAQETTGLQLNSDIAPLGLEIEFGEKPWAELVDDWSDEETAPVLSPVFHSSPYGDPDDFLHLMFHPDSAGTYISSSWYFDDDIIERIDESRRLVDEEERAEVISDLEHDLWDAYTSIPIHYDPDIWARHINVEGQVFRGAADFELRFNELTWAGE